MTIPAPTPAPDPGPMTLDRLAARWRKLLGGPGAEKALVIMLLDVQQYGAHMIETYARDPEQNWGPK